MASMTVSGSIGGKNIRGVMVRSEATEIGSSVTLAAGKAGTLTTRTDANTGTLTMGASHGITTGAKIDIYWDGGLQRNVTVGTVAGTSVPFDLGTGDDLPIATTAIVACVQTVIDVDVAAAGIVLAGVSATRRAAVEFQESDGTAILSIQLGAETEGEGYMWADGQGVTTPFSADVGKVVASNGNSAQTNIVSIGIVSDNDT